MFFSPPTVLFRCSVLFVLILWAMIFPGTAVLADSAFLEPVKRVLVLNSYHPNYTWGESVTRGIRSKLDSVGLQLKTRYEYMDTKHYPPAVIFDQLYSTFKLKYSNMRFDVIIASDNNALNFLQDYRDELFPGVPVVFCGINGYTKEMITGNGYTGVAETYDIEGTLKLALAMYPKTKHVAVVSGQSTSSKINLAQAKSILSRYSDRVQLIDLSGLNLKQLYEELHQLPPDTIILYSSNYLLPDGTTLTVPESTSLIFKATGLPIFTPWEYTMGWGVLGGMTLSGEEQGAAAAAMALSILDGTPVEALSVRTSSPIQPTFDWKVMQQLGISNSVLPSGSIVINRPESFYQRYKRLVWGVALFISYQMGVILYLLQVVSKRKRAEASLRREEQRLEMMLQLGRMENQADGTVSQYFLENCLTLLDGTLAYLALVRDGQIGPVYYVCLPSADCLPEFATMDTAEMVNSWQSLIFTGDDECISQDQGDERFPAGQAVPGPRLLAPVKDGRETIALVGIGRASGRFSTADKRHFGLLIQALTRLLQSRYSMEREAKLENQLRHSQRMEAIGTFAGGIAHDFNNILGAIHTCAELAHGELEPGSVASEDLRQVLNASKRGKSLVKRIMDFSRNQDTTRQPVPIGPIVQECHDLLRSFLPASTNLRFHDRAKSAMVLADPNQIHQVLMNLCSNAQHAMHDSPGVLEINVDAMDLDEGMQLTHPLLKPGRYTRISVSDTGVGIDPAIQNKIFDPFFTTRSAGEGTGLGLAMSHGIIKRHKGAITVDSNPGQGATFHVWLPCAHSVQSYPESQDKTPLDALSGTVLLVDDDPEMRTSLVRLLQRAGLSVIEAENAEVALQLLENVGERLDYVVTDYSMPGINGLELAGAIMKQYPDLPIILCTGFADNVQMLVLEERLEEYGVRLLLEKPFDNAELLDGIRQLRQQPIQRRS